MQFVYVLTSNYEDFYYEQFLLSSTSLKIKMPDAVIILLCDSKTNENLKGKRSEFKKLISDIIVVDITNTMSKEIEISRYLKMSMRKLIKGDFLFIDTDTIITDNLYSVNELGIKFGAVLDKHSYIENHPKKNEIINYDKKLGFNSYLSGRHYNGGIIYCTDIPETHKLFEYWYKKWLHGKKYNIIRDQPSFNMAIKKYQGIFTELDGTWNCQIAYNGLPYFINSKIIHYFTSDSIMNMSPFLLSFSNIFMKIKIMGIIPDETLELLNNQISAISPETRIIADKIMLSVINSSFFESIFLLRRKFPIVFTYLNNITTFIKNLTKLFYIKSNKKKYSGIKYYN